MTTSPFVVDRHVEPKDGRFRLNTNSGYARKLAGWWAVGHQACYGKGLVLKNLAQWIPTDVTTNGGNNRDGVFTSMDFSAWATNTRRQGLIFDGVADNLRTSADIITDETNGFTFSCWVRPAALTAEMAMHGRRHSGGGWYWTIKGSSAGDPMRFRFYGSGETAFNSNATNMVVDTWYHLAVSYRPATSLFTFFLNGKPNGTNTVTIDFGTVGTRKLWLGSLNNHNSVAFPFDGQIDDWRIWNRELSHAEILNLYISTLNGGYGDLAMQDSPIIMLSDVPEDNSSSSTSLSSSSTSSLSSSSTSSLSSNSTSSLSSSSTSSLSSSSSASSSSTSSLSSSSTSSLSSSSSASSSSTSSLSSSSTSSLSSSSTSSLSSSSSGSSSSTSSLSSSSMSSLSSSSSHSSSSQSSSSSTLALSTSSQLSELSSSSSSSVSSVSTSSSSSSSSRSSSSLSTTSISTSSSSLSSQSTSSSSHSSSSQSSSSSDESSSSVSSVSSSSTTSETSSSCSSSSVEVDLHPHYFTAVYKSSS